MGFPHCDREQSNICLTGVPDGAAMKGHLITARDQDLPRFAQKTLSWDAAVDLLELSCYEPVYACPQISDWIVCNEFFSDKGLRVGTLTKAMGEEALSYAFNLANDANPEARLWLREYAPSSDRLWNNLFAWIDAKPELPIHGVEIQIRHQLGDSKKLTAAYKHSPAFSLMKASRIEYLIQEIKKRGLQPALVEVEIFAGDTPTRRATQEQWRLYRMYAAIAATHTCNFGLWTWDHPDSGWWLPDGQIKPDAEPLLDLLQP
ncbi:uncharacterized protein LOC144639981 [Oculina patagonica]